MIIVLNKKSQEFRFIASYAGVSLIMFPILAYKINGHNYHMDVFVPLIVIGLAFLPYFIGTNLEKLIRRKSEHWAFTFIRWVPIITIAILLFAPTIAAKNRMEDTVFFGQEIAGQYVKEHSDPEELVMHSSHQSFGFMWYAKRQGVALPTDNLTKFKEYEDMGTRWILIYQWAFNVFNNEEMFNYIRYNYSIRQIGFMPNGEQYVPIYFLFEKGGSYDPDTVNERANALDKNEKIYKLHRGDVRMVYINFEDE